MKKLNILIVDDDASSTSLLQKAIKSVTETTNIDIVTGGKKAVKELSNKEYDLVFLDHEIPDMKGPEIVKLADDAIKEQASTRTHKVHVITYSAHLWQDWNKESLINIELAGHMSKGITFSKMKGVITGFINNPQIIHKAAV